MVTRHDLERYLRGHRAADAVLRGQTLQRLTSLTPDESKAEYESLCAVWEMSRGRGDQAALDGRAIADRVALRRRLAGTR